jgi:DNA-binding MarR family transcriptional regulator
MAKHVNKTYNIEAEIPLIQLLDRAQRWFERRIVQALEAKGVEGIQPADLKLLANLDCGTTYASEVARRMGVSRQSVNKLLKNLLREKLVTLENHPTQGNTKVIIMTDLGKEWIRDAVAVSRNLESELMAQIGTEHVSALRAALEAAWSSWNADP